MRRNDADRDVIMASLLVDNFAILHGRMEKTRLLRGNIPRSAPKMRCVFAEAEAVGHLRELVLRRGGTNGGVVVADPPYGTVY